MQNSLAPSAFVSSAAARISSASRNGVAFTGDSNCADCEQKWQSSGQPPLFADRIPSTSTSRPHHANRTSWASDARAGTELSGSAAKSANSSSVSRRRSSSSASPAAVSSVRAGDMTMGGDGSGRLRKRQNLRGRRRLTADLVTIVDRRELDRVRPRIEAGEVDVGAEHTVHWRARGERDGGRAHFLAVAVEQAYDTLAGGADAVALDMQGAAVVVSGE